MQRTLKVNIYAIPTHFSQTLSIGHSHVLQQLFQPKNQVAFDQTEHIACKDSSF